MVGQRLDYDALGRVTLDSQPGFQPFGFAGGLYDSDTGLVRLGARDYDGRLGRWITPDPAGFAAGGTNRYAYGWLDPVNTVDITGLGPAPTVYLGWCTADCGMQVGFGPGVPRSRRRGRRSRRRHPRPRPGRRRPGPARE